MTRLHLILSHGVTTIDVQESFESAMDNIYPLSPPSSSLQGRENLLYTSVETGRRLAIPQNNIFMVEEVEA